MLAKENTQLKQKIEAPETCSKEKDLLINLLLDSLVKEKEVHPLQGVSWHTKGRKNHPLPKSRHRISSTNWLNLSLLAMKVLKKLPIMMNTYIVNLQQINWRNTPTSIITIYYISSLKYCKTTKNWCETENNTKQQKQEMASIVTLLNMDTKQCS